ncbi:MAG: DNA repair protein RecN [Clostridiaceae bacterium]|nr:DNA repair protein RecN [Clostridiaceae bacterium]
MLIRLSISNFALIDSLAFEPQERLNVITGETGAGKSLLVDALGAITGKRISKEAIRSGTQKASVDAIFSHASNILSDEDYEAYGFEREEDDTLLISREIFAEGRNLVRINGRSVTLSVLKEIGSRFLDIHGQNDQQTIFDVTRHIDLLDRFCGDDMLTMQTMYRRVLNLYKEVIGQIRALGIDPELRRRRAEILEYQIDEIRRAGFKPGEEDALNSKFKHLLLFEKQAEVFDKISALLSIEDPQSLYSQMGALQNHIAILSKSDSKYFSLVDQVVRIQDDISQVENELFSQKQDSLYGDETLEDVRQRIDSLNRLKEKYGDSINAINSHLQKAEDELEELNAAESRLKVLHKQRIDLERELISIADSIHDSRNRAGEELSRRISRELSDLGMLNAVFEVRLTRRPKEKFFSIRGYDDVMFMFSANLGEEPLPLQKIASGGEASRIMLAIKTILADADRTQTLIFDEVDTGISGKTATIVAEKMRALSKCKQVLCVTHMAQIAAAADYNYLISKCVRNQRTVTSLNVLEKESKTAEVARLLSGQSDDKKSVDLSRQMIDRITNNDQP